MSPERGVCAALLFLVAAGPVPAAAQAGLQAADAALLMSGQEGGDLPLEVQVVVEGTGGSGTGILISAEVPLEALLAGGGANTLLRWGAYALDADGNLLAADTEAQSAQSERLRATGLAGLRIVSRLQVPGTGPLSVRFLVREEAGQQVGVRVREIDPAQPPPCVRAAAGDWLQLGPAVPAAAALPVVAAGGIFSLQVPDDASTDWRLERMDGDGEGVPLRGGAVGRGEIELVVPAGTAPGRYHLRRDERDGAEIWVAAAQAEHRAWPRIAAVLEAPVAPQIVLPALAASGSLAERRESAAGFAVLADEGVDAGMRYFYALFQRAWEEDGGVGVTSAVDAATSVGLQQFAAEPRLLAASVAAADLLDERAAARHDYAVSSAARLLLSRWVEGAASLRAGDSRAQAAGWSLLAAQSQRRMLLGRAAEQWRTAAALDAGWVEPRRSLGLLFELIGNHNLAAQQFSQILEIEPGNLEARLHLGVQSGRLGRDRAARDHLEPLLTCGESWIEIVAAEELARLDLRRRRPGAAEATLRSARERHPGDLQLALQLAAVLEDRGRRADAARLLAAFPEGGAAGAPTRHRYIPVPEENRRVVRERLAALAAPQERTPPQEQAAPQPPEDAAAGLATSDAGSDT